MLNLNFKIKARRLSTLYLKIIIYFINKTMILVYIIIILILILIQILIYFLYQNNKEYFTINSIKDIVKNNISFSQVKYQYGVPYVVFICWFGNSISENRYQALKSLIKNIGVPYILVTDDNVFDFQHNQFPFHPAFKNLSGNHKSDYIRAYLLHHYGGGYHDIKYRDLNWKNQWNDFKNPQVWIKSRREKQPSHIGFNIDIPETRWIQQKYNDVGTMGWVICRPYTKYTQELLDIIHQVLDKHYHNLLKNPSTHSGGYYSNNPFGKVRDINNNYPLRWLEIMGEHFHLLMYKYKNHLIFGLPDVVSKNYR